MLESFRQGNPNAARVWLKSVRALASAIVSIVNAFDPEIVILGGGIAGAGEMLFVPLGQTLDRIEWRPAGHRVKIVAAKLGPHAGSLGAARCAMEAADRLDKDLSDNILKTKK